MFQAAADPTRVPFRAFNKQEATPSLLGNWVEERALEDETGTNRYKQWVDTEPLSQVYNPRIDRSPCLKNPDTIQRVLQHTNAAPSRTWRSEGNEKFAQVVERQALPARYVSDSRMGARERAELEALMAEASRRPAPVAPPCYYTTTKEAVHSELPWDPILQTRSAGKPRYEDLSDQVFGTRVMCDNDMRPAAHDPTFLAELAITPKSMVDRRVTLRKEGAQPMAGLAKTARLADASVPVSVYSEAVAKAEYGHSVYGSTAANPSAPFNRYDNFTKPLSDPNKVLYNE